MKRRYVIYNADKYGSWQCAQAEHNCSELLVDESNVGESDMFDKMCEIIQNEAIVELSIIDLGPHDQTCVMSDWTDIGSSE
jgi:hypothetical protein